MATDLGVFLGLAAFFADLGVFLGLSETDFFASTLGVFLGLRDLLLVGFGVATVLGVLAGDLVDLDADFGVFLAETLAGDLLALALLLMTWLSGESACPVVASTAFGVAFPPELFRVAAFALTFLALATAFEA